MKDKHYMYNFLAIIALFSFININVMASPSEEEKIKLTIKTYENALNGSNISQILSVYAKNGVFMPSTKPTATGHDQLKLAYQSVFKALDLDVVFQYEDIVHDNEIAYVRTRSKGEITLLDKNMVLKNQIHRELFVLRKKNGEWKIAQYMFNRPDIH